MRLDPDGLVRLQHELSAGRHELEGTIERLDRQLAAVPKKERRLSDAIFRAGDRMVPAFKALTGMRGILGNRDVKRAFDLRRVHSSQRAILTRMLETAKDATARPHRGVAPAAAEIDIREIELVAFAVSRGALRREPPPELVDLAERVEDLERRITGIEEERRRDRLHRDACATVHRDLAIGSEVLSECLLAVRRHEALVARKAELAAGGGKRRAASAARDGWTGRIEAKRAELAKLASRLEDVRWETLGEKETLRAFFSEHPGRVLLMASILKNIAVLCGGLVKYAITEVTPFEIGVAARAHGDALRLLGEGDPLRSATEDDRRAAFEALGGSEEALGAYNAVNRLRAEEATLREGIALARKELGDLERWAAEGAERAARALAAQRDAVRGECSRARQEAKVHRGEVRRYYHGLRRRYGLRRGIGGFPEGHAAMLSDLVSEDTVVWRAGLGGRPGLKGIRHYPE